MQYPDCQVANKNTVLQIKIWGTNMQFESENRDLRS